MKAVHASSLSVFSHKKHRKIEPLYGNVEVALYVGNAENKPDKVHEARQLIVAKHQLSDERAVRECRRRTTASHQFKMNTPVGSTKRRPTWQTLKQETEKVNRSIGGW